MTQLSISYVMRFVASQARARYRQDLAAANEDPASNKMAFLHAIATSMKALFTNDANNGVEVMRQSCGGHGYSMYSGIPNQYLITTASVTYEGDTYVLYQQTARYVIKNEDFIDHNEHEYAGPVTQILKYLKQVLTEKNTNLGKAAWNSRILCDAIETAKFFAMMYAQKEFYELTHSLEDPDIKDSFLILWEIYVITKILEHRVSAIKSRVYSANQLRDMELRKEALYISLLPYADSLAEGFGYEDSELASALAEPDGKAYECLLQLARENPINQAGLVPKL